MDSNELQLRAATDPEFRRALIADPRATLTQAGVELPAAIAVRVVEAASDELVIAIPPMLPDGIELDDDALAGAAGGVTPTMTFLAAIVGMTGIVAVKEATR